MSHINIEIKARSSRNNEIRKKLLEMGADFKGEDHQIDTYFKVDFGRLKLREGNIENNLIAYSRNNRKGSKKSEVVLYEAGNKTKDLKKVMESSHKILAVVDKRREIYFIDNVKFHLDRVNGLGEFMEIEAIDFSGDVGEEKLKKQCEEYMKILKIEEKDLIENSYSDMLMG